MFKIRSEQMAACAEVSTQSFADRVTAHLVDTAPAQSAAIGAPALRDMALRGVARAASHGITARGDVCLFLAAAAALGEGFDSDPQLPWAADLLGPDNPLDAASKVRQLWSVVESDHLPEGGAEASSAEPSVAVAVELAEAAKGALGGPVAVGGAVVPCPLRPRFYPFSL